MSEKFILLIARTEIDAQNDSILVLKKEFDSDNYRRRKFFILLAQTFEQGYMRE